MIDITREQALAYNKEIMDALQKEEHLLMEDGNALDGLYMNMITVKRVINELAINKNRKEEE